MARITLLFPLSIALGLAACATTAPEATPAPPPPAPPPVVAAAPEPEPATLTELLFGIEAAYRKGDYDRGLKLVKQVYELKTADVTTLDRVGSIYYVLGRYGEALTVWQRALPFEKNLRRRQELSSSITVARRTLGLEEPSTAAPSAPKVAAAKPKTRAPLPPDQKEIDALYRKGVKHYALGEFLQAATAFLRMQEIDPGNQRAAKALERLHLEGAGAAR